MLPELAVTKLTGAFQLPAASVSRPVPAALPISINEGREMLPSRVLVIARLPGPPATPTVMLFVVGAKDTLPLVFKANAPQLAVSCKRVMSPVARVPPIV